MWLELKTQAYIACHITRLAAVAVKKSNSAFFIRQKHVFKFVSLPDILARRYCENLDSTFNKTWNHFSRDKRLPIGKQSLPSLCLHLLKQYHTMAFVTPISSQQRTWDLETHNDIAKQRICFLNQQGNNRTFRWQKFNSQNTSA